MIISIKFNKYGTLTRSVWPMTYAVTAFAMHLRYRYAYAAAVPFQNRFCTYRQSRDWIEKYCADFISPDQMKLLMGDSCARVLGVKLEAGASTAVGGSRQPVDSSAATKTARL